MKKTRFNYLIPCLFILISYTLYSQQDQNEYTVKFTSEEIMIEEITNSPVERMTLTELNQQLKEAIENEDYEAASNIRDEINRRKGN